MSKTPNQTTKTTTAKAVTPKEIKENLILPNSKVTVTLAWSQVEPAYNQVLQKAAQNVKADGFRIGKVPPQVAEKLINKEALYEEVVQRVLPQAYSKALQDQKKLPISRPEVDPVKMEKGEDWVFDVFFAEMQPVELGKYEDTVKKALLAAQKELKEKTDELKKTAESKKDEKEEPGHEGHHHETPKELTVDQQEDIKLKHIFRSLVETVKPKVQEILIHAEVNRELQRLLDQLRQLNLKVEDYLRSRQITGEQLQQEYAGTALTSLQIEFILAEIAKAQKITVEDKEVNDMLDKIGGGKLTEAQKQDSEYRSYLFSTLLKQKVVKHLISL